MEDNSSLDKSVVESSNPSMSNQTFNIMVLDDDAMILKLTQVFVKNSFATWNEKYTLHTFIDEYKALEHMKVSNLFAFLFLTSKIVPSSRNRVYRPQP